MSKKYDLAILLNIDFITFIVNVVLIHNSKTIYLGKFAILKEI